MDTLITNRVNSRLDNSLSVNEQEYIKDVYQRIKKVKFQNSSPDDIINTLVKLFAKKINKLRKQLKSIKYKTKPTSETNIKQILNKKIHDYQDETKIAKKTKHLHIDALFGINNLETIQRKLNPNGFLRKQYLVLDSRNKSLVNSSSSLFYWEYVPTVHVKQGTVNSVVSVKNLMSIKLYQPMLPRPIGYSSISSGRISILFNNFSTQSIIASDTRKYHFMTRPREISVVGYELQIEDYLDGEYKFHEPITTFDRIELSFGDPLNVLTFHDDRYNVTFTYGATTNVIFDTAHNLNVYDVISFGDFTTDDINADNIAIQEMNNKYGIQVSSVANSTTVSVNIDTSSITPTAGLNIVCYIDTRRIILPVEMTYMV